MAGAGFFALFDDIATLLDDVALLSKLAAQKTAGVLGDDVALNAQQVSGMSAQRELAVVWAVCKGSFANKLIIVPLALAISVFAGWAVMPLLMAGGAYLCFEGVEKLAHRFLHKTEADLAHHESLRRAVHDPQLDLVAFEKEKIKGAIRVDFILSAEIVAIALWSLGQATLLTQFLVLSTVAIAMTLGVYGVVAGIVKFDDLGLWLMVRAAAGSFQHAAGRSMVKIAPYVLKFLSVVGTIAMFLVGGSIVVHGIAPLHHALGAFSDGGWVQTIGVSAAHVGVGVVVGVVVLPVVIGVQRMVKKFRSRASLLP
jgi:uncharacterized protein